MTTVLYVQNTLNHIWSNEAVLETDYAQMQFQHYSASYLQAYRLFICIYLYE